VKFRRAAQINVLAAAVAFATLIAGGVGYRAYFTYLNRAPERVAFERGTLNAQFPLELDGWTGREQPLEERIIKAADVDDYLQRIYTRRGESITLYIAAGVRARDLVPHRPDVCYPTHGWTMKGREDHQLRLADGAEIAARLYTFAPSKLTGENIRVLNFYYVDGEAWPDVELLRSVAQKGQTSLRYVAQIQIACAFRDSLSEADSWRRVRDFAIAAAPEIRKVLEREAGGETATAHPASRPAP
jgi:EpsI family protein